jgi:Lamin Tail Domain
MMRLRLVAAAAFTVVSVIAAVPAPSAAAIPPAQFGRIVINPKGLDYPITNQKLNQERVTIVNARARPVQLEGFTVSDADGNVYTFGRFRLGPGRWIELHTGHGIQARLHVYWGRNRYVWDNDTDTARLRSPTGRLVDTCRWDHEFPVHSLACGVRGLSP